MSQATAFAQCDLTSPAPGSSVSPRHAFSCDVETESPRKTRRVRRRMRPTHVRDDPVCVPSPTIADPALLDVSGAVIYDCRPRILPVLIQLKDIGRSPRFRPVASASLAAPPVEETMMIGGVSPERVAIPELGVAPPDDPRTYLEDELLQISPLPTIVSPIPALPVSPSLYPEVYTTPGSGRTSDDGPVSVVHDLSRTVILRPGDFSGYVGHTGCF